MDATEVHKVKRVRSPNYPAFDLEEAIEKTRTLFKEVGKNGAHESVALKALGHASSKSGASLRVLATLKSFDLISEQKGHIVFTQIGIDAVLYQHDKEKYLGCIREAALKPRLFNELYSKYKGYFPEDESLKAELVGVYGFNLNTVILFLNVFHRTMDYAQLGGDRETEIQPGPPAGQENRVISMSSQAQTTSRASGTLSTNQQLRSYPVPLPNGNNATIIFDRLPIQKSDLELLKQWIDFFGMSLVREEKQQHEGNPA